MIQLDLDSVPDLLMPCTWVTGAAEHLTQKAHEDARGSVEVVSNKKSNAAPLH